MKQELEARTKRFALAIIAAAAEVPKSKAADVICHQLLKSATSIGANYREACRATSHDDFIYKVSICEKEAAETEYWLELLIEGQLGSGALLGSLQFEARELLAIFSASGRTAKSRR